MTAFISFPYQDHIEILVDGATCTPSGMFFRATDKLVVSPHIPLAVTGRGRHHDLANLAEKIVAMSACGSVDETLENVCEWLEAARAAPPGGDHFEILIGAFSESTGPRHFQIQSFEADDLPAWTLIDHSGQIAAGVPDIEATDLLAATGLTAADFAHNAKAGGLAMMEYLRRIPGHDERNPHSVHGYWIGAHCDHASVSAEGVTVTRLKTWPDVLFQPIRP